VAGVCLGIGTLLWATDAPAGDPALRPPAAGPTGVDEPAVALPDDGAPAESETAPVDPPPLELPPLDPPVDEPPAGAGPRRPPRPARGSSRSPSWCSTTPASRGSPPGRPAAFERGGWPVSDTGGLRGRIRATTVYYPPGQQAEARAFAERFDGIDRVLPRLAGLPGSGLTVVVTRDFRP
jgi:hypothetical protein